MVPKVISGLSNRRHATMHHQTCILLCICPQQHIISTHIHMDITNNHKHNCSALNPRSCPRLHRRVRPRLSMSYFLKFFNNSNKIDNYINKHRLRGTPHHRPLITCIRHQRPRSHNLPPCVINTITPSNHLRDLTLMMVQVLFHNSIAQRTNRVSASSSAIVQRHLIPLPQHHHHEE
jgi:hypothetical protein